MDWTCPYCNQPTTLTSPNLDIKWQRIGIAKDRFNDKEWKGLRYTAITCPNIACKQLGLEVELTKSTNDPWQGEIDAGTQQTWKLLPDSFAKPQPDYIPRQIVDDYTEACRIKDLSPKASATLARRCLQGMIRDFWGINVASKKLYDEVTELEEKISATEWEAIDALRSMGNIGAHMKQDVSIIIEVEPEEAGLLIEFIEGLFKDWYIFKHDKDERNKRLKALATSKGEKPRDSKSKTEEKVNE